MVRVRVTWKAHISVADAASPKAPTSSRVWSWWTSPLVISASHRATSTSGRACSRVIANDASSRRGSAR